MAFRRLSMLLLFAFANLAAAGETGTLTGRVKDPTGGRIAGATVKLTAKPSGDVRRAITDAKGEFVFSDLPHGSYALHISSPGFQDFLSEVAIGAATAERLKIAMQVAAQLEVVEVTDSFSKRKLAAENNADSTYIDDDLLRQLPLSITNQSLIGLLGNYLSPAAQGTDEASIIIDGLEDNQFNVPMTAIRRLFINRNPYSAEYRRPGKARVEVITRYGSSRHLHAGFTASAENSLLSARDPFVAQKPSFSRDLGEGNLGGPITERLTYFLSGEYGRNDVTRTVNAVTATGPVILSLVAPARSTQFLGRLDLRLNEKHSFTGRYQYGSERAQNKGVGGFDLPEHGSDSARRQDRLQIYGRSFLTDKVISEFRMSAEKQRDRAGQPASGPELVVSGAFIGGPSQLFSRGRRASYEFEEIGSWFPAVHNIRGGVRARTKSVFIRDQSNFGGKFEFASLEDFVNSRPFSFRVQQGIPDIHFTLQEFDFFVNDDIKVSARLNVAAGVRYEYQSAASGVHAFAPRFTISYAPWTPKTVFRAGTGIFHERVPEKVTQRLLQYDGEHIREVVISNPSFPDALRSSMQTNPPPSLVRLAPDFTVPYLWQSTMSVEHELRPRTFLSMEYAHLRGIHLFRAWDRNAPRPGESQRPDGAFAQVLEVRTDAFMRSDALTLGFRGRIGNRVKTTVNYVLSRTINNTADAGAGAPFHLPADSYDLGAEIGRADFDRRHRLTVTGVVGLPWSFRLGAVISAASGAPFDITTGRDDNHDSLANDRPPGVTRNTGKGPSYRRVDLRITKLFKFRNPQAGHSKSDLVLNLDAFNALNSTIYENYVGVMTSPFFGRAHSAQPGRRLQLSVSYSFSGAAGGI